MALALYWLIHSQFPRDNLDVIGFSDYAMEIKGEELPEITWNAWVSGTNMQHALMLSRKLLSKQKVSSKQILMITDGEPTAHLEGGYAYFNYPPSYRTIEGGVRGPDDPHQPGSRILHNPRAARPLRAGRLSERPQKAGRLGVTSAETVPTRRDSDAFPS